VSNKQKLTPEKLAERVAKLPPESDYPPRELKARRMWVGGYTHAEIGKELGVSRSRAAEMVTDPKRLAATARKAEYGTPCVDCGKRTNPGGKVGAARCADCNATHLHETRHWTPENVIAELRAWAQDLGRPPVAHEALVAGARVSVNTVQREFGSWAKAMRAAGFELHAKGNSVRGRRLNELEIRRIGFLYKSGLPMQGVADEMEVSLQTVVNHLNALGIKRRTPLESRRIAREGKAGVAQVWEMAA
jgi:hypothetical protein